MCVRTADIRRAGLDHAALLVEPVLVWIDALLKNSVNIIDIKRMLGTVVVRECVRMHHKAQRVRDDRQAPR